MEWFRIVLREKAREQLDDPGDMEKSIKTGKLSGAIRELTGLRLYCCPFWITIDNFLQRIKSFVIYNRPDDNLLQRIKSLVIYNSSDVVLPYYCNELKPCVKKDSTCMSPKNHRTCCYWIIGHLLKIFKNEKFTSNAFFKPMRVVQTLSEKHTL